MIMIGKCSEEHFFYKVHCEQYSSKACEKGNGYPHTTLNHDKCLLEVLHGHLQCVDV